MAEKHIVVLAGDGIGPEVTAWAKKALETVGEQFGHQFTFEDQLIGHSAIEATGNPLPDETLEACKKADAILLGAVGHPKYDNDPSAKVRPEQGLLKIRKELGLYTNIRPIQIFEELAHASSIKPELLKDVNIMFFRELTGGIYFGQPRERQEDGTVAIDTMRYSKMEVRRIAEKAFKSAQTRNKVVHSVDKANVLESSRLWRETVNEVAQEYPDVKLEHMFIDNAAMQLIRYPRQFDVVLTGNMFGDILTDEASQITGSLGMLPSASIGDSVGIYEPIHGSAPDIAGQNKANPLATILSAALLLDISFGMQQEAQVIIDAVDQVLKAGLRTVDIKDDTTLPENILSTEEMGTQVVHHMTQVVPS